MDLSAVIFVVLAVAWAVYLIPKALKHHDDMASDRLVEGHSDKVRILSRHGKKTAQVEDVPSAAEAPVAAPVETVPAATAPAPRALPTRAAAKRAARNRRRVLSALTLALVALAGLAFLGYVPWWSTAIPGGLVVLFLVVARLSVRNASQRRRGAGPSARSASASTAATAIDPVAAPAPAEVLTAQLADEDTAGLARRDIESALADDGSLWDPLPMTLPTYVNKARARRTVRTIELTGINSSGHDESASALACEAEQSAKDARAAEDAEAAQRRVAGA